MSAGSRSADHEAFEQPSIRAGKPVPEISKPYRGHGVNNFYFDYCEK